LYITDVYICAYVYICMCTYTYVYMCIYLYICTSMYMCVCVCMYMYTYVYIRILMRSYVYVYIDAYVYIYMGGCHPAPLCQSDGWNKSIVSKALTRYMTYIYIYIYTYHIYQLVCRVYNTYVTYITQCITFIACTSYVYICKHPPPSAVQCAAVHPQTAQWPQTQFQINTSCMYTDIYDMYCR
jgi:hypothetical protein